MIAENGAERGAWMIEASRTGRGAWMAAENGAGCGAWMIESSGGGRVAWMIEESGAGQGGWMIEACGAVALGLTGLAKRIPKMYNKDSERTLTMTGGCVT